MSDVDDDRTDADADQKDKCWCHEYGDESMFDYYSDDESYDHYAGWGIPTCDRRHSDEGIVDLDHKLCDYHPLWKKSNKTFLDVYIVAKQTEVLLTHVRKSIIGSIRVPRLRDDFEEDTEKGMESTMRELDKLMKRSKEKSVNMLSSAINLPVLVVEKIFTYIVDSYNYNFVYIGPEDVQWQYEEHSLDAEAAYYKVSNFYESIMKVISDEEDRELYQGRVMITFGLDLADAMTYFLSES